MNTAGSARPLHATIVPAGPFDFAAALAYLRTSPSAIAETVTEERYLRAVRLPASGRDVVLEVSARPGALNLILHGGDAQPDGCDLAEAVPLAARVFGAHCDSSALVADIATDPVFAAVAARFRGLHPVLIADPFESLVWAILGQQINVAFAAKLKRALIERWGRVLTITDRTGTPHTLRLFPEPETLARLSHEGDLRPLQFSRQKSEYTILAARAAAGGTLDLAALRPDGVEPEDAAARLMRLKGVGRWTAEYVLMRGLGYPDVIPAGDGGLKRAIGQAYGLGRLATEEEVRDHAVAWAPWRSYAALYWWFTLQLAARERRRPVAAGSGPGLPATSPAPHTTM